MKKGLCECGCGAKTTISNRTRESKGHVKGQPMRFIIGHVHRGKKPALERRIKTSRTLTGREPVLSPYVPRSPINLGRRRSNDQGTGNYRSVARMG